jgi:hypothetical protein
MTFSGCCHYRLAADDASGVEVPADPPQFRLDVRCVLVAEVAILFERRRDDGFQPRRNQWVEMRDRPR